MPLAFLVLSYHSLCPTLQIDKTSLLSNNTNPHRFACQLLSPLNMPVILLSSIIFQYNADGTHLFVHPKLP